MTASRLIISLAVALAAGRALAATPSPDGPTEFSCPRIEAGEVEGTFLKGKVYQGQRGWFFRDGSDLRQFYSYGEDALGYIHRFAAALRHRGVTLVYLPVPPKAVVQPERLTAQIIRDDEFSIDLAQAGFRAMLAELSSAGMLTANVLDSPVPIGDDDFFFARDHHWRPLGARVSAAAVAAAIHADPGFAELSPASYVTTDLGRQDPIRSAMLFALQRMCADELPQERAEVFETSAGEATADDLLGGDGTTPVTLVGTSFSDLDIFNFAGFLQEAIGLEVANYAISGGGSFTSIIGYILSGALEDAPPKYLVWENPGYDRLDGDGLNEFRQLIPAVYGYCDGEAKLSEAELHIEAGGEATVAVDSPETVAGHRYYLAMRAGDTAIRNMTLSIDQGGDGEEFAVTRSDRAPATDRFFVEFSDDIPTPVRAVTISGQPDRAVDFTIQICKAPEEQS